MNTVKNIDPAVDKNWREIAADLGVSRMPVREALNQLEKEGLVTFFPYRAVAGGTHDGSDIKEQFEMGSGNLLNMAIRSFFSISTRILANGTIYFTRSPMSLTDYAGNLPLG